MMTVHWLVLLVLWSMNDGSYSKATLSIWHMKLYDKAYMLKEFHASMGENCGVPILPASYHDCENSSAAPINMKTDNSSLLSWHTHIKRSAPISHTKTPGFLVLIPLIVRVFMQINKAFY